MDMATIAGAVTGLRFVKDALQVALDYKIDIASQTKISEALDRLGAAQDTLYDLRDENFRLQTENAGLRDELKARDDWKARSASYHLHETSGGAIVYQSVPPVPYPTHYACPSCFEQRTIQILQDQRVKSGAFYCPGRKVVYPVKAATPQPAAGPRRSSYLQRDDQF
jgi:hypothetical protein